MSLLVVGSTAFDTVETPHGTAKDCLGGSSTYFSLAARLFTQVRLVSVVGADQAVRFDLQLNARDVSVLYRAAQHVEPAPSHRVDPGRVRVGQREYLSVYRVYSILNTRHLLMAAQVSYNY